MLLKNSKLAYILLDLQKADAITYLIFQELPILNIQDTLAS